MKNIDVSVVKNGCGHSGLGKLKLAVSLKNESMEQADFMCVDKNSGNLKVTLIIFALCWSEMGMAI